MKFGVGQSVRRVEDERFLKGTGIYVDDIALPEQAYGCVLRSPHAHADLLSVDADAARTAPGVLAVYTGADIAGRLQPLARELPLELADGGSPVPVTLPHLATDRVRFAGQPVAFVVAETLAAAKDAIDLIEADYDDRPAVTSAEEALEESAPLLHEEAPGNLSYGWDMGDKAATEAAFASAAHTVSVRVVNQRVVVNSMEPRAINIRHDAADDTWEAWVGTQGAHAMRAKIAMALGVETDRIHVHVPDVGGGFGMKLMAHPEYGLCALASKDTGRPVKWVGDRSESFLSDCQGRDVVSVAEGAFDADGKVLAYRIRSTSNLGAYYSTYGVGIHTTFSVPLTGGMYDTPCFHHSVRAAFTNTTPMDAYRGAGRPETIHMTEQVMDAAARQIGLSPVEIRRRNFVRQDQLPHKTPGGFTFDSLDCRQVMERAVELSDFDGFEARREDAAARGRIAGIGLAYYMERTGGAPFEFASLRVLPEGRIEMAAGTQSTGQGHETAWAQVVSEALGVEISAVNMLAGDSEVLPGGGGTGGARSAIIASQVLLRTADDVIAKGRTAAAERLEAAEGDIEFSAEDGGRFRIAGTDRSISLYEAAAVTGEILGEGSIDDGVGTFPNGCHVAEVEIDTETGNMEVTRYTIVDDFGVLLNPMLVEGQVHGGIAQGIGQIMCEGTAFDPDTAQPLTASFMDYRMPRAADMPDFVFDYVEVPAKTNPLGLKGCGEAGACGGLSTTSLAVIDALKRASAPIPEPPYTPLSLWRALSTKAVMPG